MAQLPALNFDLSRIPSDGTFEVPTGVNYVQINPQDPEYIKFLALLSKHYNDDPTRAGFRAKQFVGSLPRGYTYWWCVTQGGNSTLQTFGHPNGLRAYFRSAKNFKNHIIEIMNTNASIENQTRAYFQNLNNVRAYNAIKDYNYWASKQPGFGYGSNLNPYDPTQAIGLFTPFNVEQEVRTYQFNHPVINVTCACILR